MGHILNAQCHVRQLLCAHIYSTSYLLSVIYPGAGDIHGTASGKLSERVLFSERNEFLK